MPNIFMLYMPPGNREAMVHYEDTIRQRVPLARISKYLPISLKQRLRDIFGDKPIAVWGSRDTVANRRKFDQMTPRDDILIVEGETIKLLGLVAAKVISPEISRELWKNLLGNESAGWDLVYFIANPREINLPFTAFCRLMGYAENYRLQGFSTVAQDRLDAFYGRYDDLYDVLVQLRAGQAPAPRPESIIRPPVAPVVPGALAEVTEADVEQVMQSKEISEHVRMQWTLARLGLKAGDKIWVPPGDQTKIRRLYEFNEFEPQFSAGIDLPAGYFENIDVVWKEQFKIDAAFEIENSTAIYSGLLRFADLTIVAPNTIYPLFLVAPSERRDQVRNQLRRPAFEKFHLMSKVRFLSYESISEIDRFMENTTHGLNMDLMKGRSETFL